MRIGIPVWNGQVSPVFDTAGHLLLIDMADGAEVARDRAALTESVPSRRAMRLTELGIEVLICCGISRSMYALLTAQGIAVVPHVCGETDQVAVAFAQGGAIPSNLLMPGCRGRARGWRGGRGRNCRGFEPPKRTYIAERKSP